MVLQARRGGSSSDSPIEIASPTPIEDPFTSKEIRIVHQNVNTISVLCGFNQVGVILEKVQKDKIDVFTTNEVNVNLSDSKVRSEYFKAYRSKHRQCLTQAAWAPTTIAANKYRSGGNQVTLFGAFTDHVKNKAFDKVAGSWSLITVETKKGPLSIIATYRVSQSSLKQAGPKTIYAQEYSALQANGTAAPKPRKRCLKELESVINQQVFKGHMVMLNIDANESVHENQDLKKFCNDLQLTNLVQKFSP